MYRIAAATLTLFAAAALAQSAPPPSSLGPTQSTQARPATAQPQYTQPKGPGAGADYGHGAGDIGSGAGKGVGEAAKGTGKGAVDLVTLHPLNAAGNVGKGAAVGTKDVGVGAAKGTGKVLRGTGKLLKKPF